MIIMEDLYLGQALFCTREILNCFSGERSTQAKLKALMKNGIYTTVNSLTGDIFANCF